MPTAPNRTSNAPKAAIARVPIAILDIFILFPSAELLDLIVVPMPGRSTSKVNSRRNLY